MSLEELRKQAVAKSLERAISRGNRIMEKFLSELEEADADVIRLTKAVTCDHTEVELDGEFMYPSSTCKKCGYVWSDQ